MRLLSLIIALALAATAEAAPERIVSLGGGVTATVHALGAPIVAVDASSPRPTDKTPVVGYYRQISAEGVLALRPDLIIGPDGMGPPAAVEQLRAAGVRVVQLPEAKSIPGAIERIEAVGKAVERPADALVAALKAKVEEARALQKDALQNGKAKPRVLFVFVHGGAALQVAGGETAADAMIAAAGGENAVSGYDGYRPLAAEALVLARPDVVLATPRSLAAAGGEAGLWKTPGMAATPAGQKKRLVVIDDNRLLGFGPDTGDAVLELTRELHGK